MSRKPLYYLYRQLLRPIGDSRTTKIVYHTFINTCLTPEDPKVSVEVVNYLGPWIPCSDPLTFSNSLKSWR
jgi:hypothetical protein